MIRKERLGVYLSLEEKSWIAHLARIEGGLSLTALIRLLVFKAAMRHGLVSLTGKIEPAQFERPRA